MKQKNCSGQTRKKNLHRQTGVSRHNGGQIRGLLKPLDEIVLWWSDGFQRGHSTRPSWCPETLWSLRHSLGCVSSTGVAGRHKRGRGTSVESVAHLTSSGRHHVLFGSSLRNTSIRFLLSRQPTPVVSLSVKNFPQTGTRFFFFSTREIKYGFLIITFWTSSQFVLISSRETRHGFLASRLWQETFVKKWLGKLWFFCSKSFTRHQNGFGWFQHLLKSLCLFKTVTTWYQNGYRKLRWFQYLLKSFCLFKTITTQHQNGFRWF